MDYERLLISKTAQTGKINTLLSTGIRDDHFVDEELGQIFRFMADHTRKYRTAPSFQTVRNEFPLHNFELTDESVSYLQDEFLKRVKRRYAIESIRDLTEAVDNPKLMGDLDSLFLEKSREFATLVPSAQVSRFSDMDKRIEDYERGIGVSPGIKTGINTIDEAIGGIQQHEYVTISGWTGTGKSTLGQWFLFNSWMQGRTGMMISLEMSKEALWRKWDTMYQNFEYNRLKKGQLTEEEVERWRENAAKLKGKPHDIIVLDSIRGCTVDRVYGELTRWQPDICCIDYITLMSDGRAGGAKMWEQVTYLTQALKQVANTLKIPIIGIAQTNRAGAQGGAEMDNIAYSVSIIQDSDLVFGLHQDEEMKKEKRMQLRLLKNRDGYTTNVDLSWRMETMEFSAHSLANAFKARHPEPDTVER